VRILIRAVAGTMLAGSALLLAAGCGGAARTGAPAPATAAQDAQTQASNHRCSPTQVRPTPALAFAAVAHGTVLVYGRPGSRPLRRLGPFSPNGYPTILGVVGSQPSAGCAASWYRVALPGPPNGDLGWVRASTVRVQTVRMRIVVALAARKVTLYRNGRPILRATVTIGAPRTPTPAGRFYVTERFLLDDTTGPLGPAALGISAHSTVLTTWAQGGPIALHGTNEPGLLGRAASHGCIRLDNRVMRRLFAATPAGTPVIIRR